MSVMTLKIFVQMRNNICIQHLHVGSLIYFQKASPKKETPLMKRDQTSLNKYFLQFCISIVGITLLDMKDTLNVIEYCFI